MVFSSSNFLLTYANNDRVLQVQTSTEVLVGGFSVCNMQKAMTEANVLWISLGDNFMKLEFANGGDARLALNLLQTVVDSLIGNCAFSSTPDKNYVHQQVAPSSIWAVTHNLAKIPAITILNTSLEQVVADFKLDSGDPLNKIIINFDQPTAGRATFN